MLQRQIPKMTVIRTDNMMSRLRNGSLLMILCILNWLNFAVSLDLSEVVVYCLSRGNNRLTPPLI